nr:hypothetical protein [Tanacetum cinerariifolium]
MSDSEDSTVSYTTVSSPYEGRSGDVSLGVDGPPPLPAAASPTTESPGYIPESDPDEDPKQDDNKDPEEDPADYPADHDDEEEEEEPYIYIYMYIYEEEHPASADSIPPPPALLVTARISFRPQPLTLSFTKEDAKRFLAMPIPPPSPLTPL